MTWRELNLRAGALVRSVRARVIDASARGCLVESDAEIDEGAIALLHVDDGDQTHTEAVRICRSMPRPGGPMPFAAALEFLPLAPPASGSMRQQLARTEVLHEGMEDPATRTKSGPNENSGRGSPPIVGPEPCRNSQRDDSV